MQDKEFILCFVILLHTLVCYVYLQTIYDFSLQAYAGFQVMEGSSGTPVAVATGNWGCGAFKGDSRLKVIMFLHKPFDI